MLAFVWYDLSARNSPKLLYFNIDRVKVGFFFYINDIYYGLEILSIVVIVILHINEAIKYRITNLGLSQSANRIR